MKEKHYVPEGIVLYCESDNVKSHLLPGGVTVKVASKYLGT